MYVKSNQYLTGKIICVSTLASVRTQLTLSRERYLKFRNRTRTAINSVCVMSGLILGFFTLVLPAKAIDFPDTPYILPYTDIWDVLADNPSPLVHVVEIGKDSTGKKMYAIKVSDNAAVDEDEPAFLFTGVIHGKEIVGLRSVLNLVERLVSKYDSSAETRSIVDSFEVWIVPAMNPWGYQIPNNAQRKNFNGVDLNSSSGYRWASCYLSGECLDPSARKYRGPFPDSEPEIQAMNALIKNIKPIYGITFHAGQGGERGKIVYSLLDKDKGPDGEPGDIYSADPVMRSYYKDDIATIRVPEKLHARYVANEVLRPAIIDNSRLVGGVLCQSHNVPDACRDTPANGFYLSTTSPHRNRTSWAYAATGMLDFLIETHEGPTLDTAFRSPYFYEKNPVLTVSQQQNFDNAVEYSRNYTDGMFGLLDHSVCRNEDGSEGFTGPGVTGTVVDEFGQPLEAEIRIVDWEQSLIPDLSHLHADYIDIDNDGYVDYPNYCTGVKTGSNLPCGDYNDIIIPENPLYGTDLSPRKSHPVSGRFYRMFPPSGEFRKHRYTVEFKFPGKRLVYRVVEEAHNQSCVVDLGEVQLSPPITDCSVAPNVLSPAQGEKLATENSEATWESNGCHFFVRAGSTVGGSDYLSHTSLGSKTSVSLASVPLEGGDVHFRLYYRNPNVVGDLPFVDYKFAAPTFSNCEGDPSLRGPVEGTTLAPASDNIEFVTNGCIVWATVGTSTNEYHYESYERIVSAQDPLEISGYPSDGSDVLVHLSYKDNISANLVTKISYQFKTPEDTQCTQPPRLLSHDRHGVLATGSDHIEWTSNGCHYWIYAGSAPGRNQYMNKSLAGSNQVTLTGYPSDGTDVHLTLLYRNTNLGGPWSREAFVLRTQ